ncbi:uncharacterized protein LOC141611879 [Silene latifolia]|uniref:uncharacterized protein LOC141611879 n=1 Tax=Silene latifolia TaxID=37657 RepID=UPI003D76B80F
MAAEVSMKIKNDTESGLVTRDFLGGCSFIESKELDLDLDVPSGWEKRLDLKSGNVYIQRHIPANTQSHHQGTFPNTLSTKLQHVDLFPKSANVNSLPSSYTSVCTLDKVRVALDRAERSSSQCLSRKRLTKETEDEDETCATLASGQNGLLVAAACPGCFLYVLISKNDPKCPNCNSAVQLPVMTIKKPKIDLNL